MNKLRLSIVLLLLMFVIIISTIRRSLEKEITGRQKHISSYKNAARPNILFIMADDLTTQAISAYGGIYKDVAPTPNIDQIAKEGILFKNFVCTNAICGPSRASILTGKYSHVNGYYKNEGGGKFNPDQWTFPQELQKQGYQTVLFGKWHLGSEPKGFSTYTYHNTHGQQGRYWNPIYNQNGTNKEIKGYATNTTTDLALDWMKNKRDTQAPFLMLLQYKAPHRPWRPDVKYQHAWDGITMPFPETFNDDYKGRELTAGNTEMTMEYFSRRDMKLQPPKSMKGKKKLQWEFYGTRKGQVVQLRGMSDKEGRNWRYQTFIKDYLACVKSVDDNIGRVLAYLKEQHLDENTIVVLTSDQGFYLGDHGFFDKRFIYEESLKMPFIMKYPKRIRPQSYSTDLVANIDIAPTLLEMAKTPIPAGIQGESFYSQVTGNIREIDRKGVYYHYYEYPYWHHVQPHYGIRTKEFTLAHFYYDIDVWELYDLEKDPNQLNNCINDSAYQNTVSTLKKELQKLMNKYDNKKSMTALKKITSTDFGALVEKKDEEATVQEIITK